MKKEIYTKGHKECSNEVTVVFEYDVMGLGLHLHHLPTKKKSCKIRKFFSLD